jgi:aminopeptidase YwaD
MQVKNILSLTVLVLFLAGVNTNYGQTVSTNLQKHVEYLSDDKLEGRATGSAGEQMASTYIAKVFADMELNAAGDNNTYLQAFDVHAGKILGKNNAIEANAIYSNNSEVYPHPMSANGSATGTLLAVGYGISATTLNYDDYSNKDVRGKIVLIQFSSPDGTHPHSKYIDFNDERLKIKSAQEKGAVGIIFYNTDINYEVPTSEYKNNITAENIPVMVVNKNIAEKLLTYTGNITINTSLEPVIKTGHNVLGFIDNKAANTIVIGAHYDHLGHGEIDGSLYRGDPAIHNGADDNASGVALIIELAKQLKNSNLKNNNYLFIAFSGEEMGLFGSKAFVNSTAMQNYTINYMLNYDMVGRLDTSNTIIINGVGSSTNWEILNKVNTTNLKLKTTESGIGPSDQTSFYLKDIPVLHFFTGSHNDYHKPSDDAQLINYTGIQTILDYSYNLIKSLNDSGKINFTKTKEENNDNAPRFSVTLGIIPDYTYSEKGMRIDGVTEGKPGSKAGVKPGDIVIKMGEYEVTDMMGYMQGLSKFKKGDTTIITIIREKETIELEVTF